MPLAGNGHLPHDIFVFTPPCGKIVRVRVPLPPGPAELMPIRCKDEWPHGTADQDGDGDGSHIDYY